MESRFRPFTTSRRVEFRETDAAGIMHFSAYFGMMEEAEHEFLRFLQLPLFRPVAGGTISWPRVAAACDFISPVKFEDVLQIDVWVDKLGSKSVTYAFRFQCEDRPVARGSMTSVCCDIRAGGMSSVSIPSDVVEKLSPYLATQ